MRALYDVISHKFTRDEVSEGTKWILLLAGACYLQAGLFQWVVSSPDWKLFAAGGVMVALGILRFYFVRFLAIAGWTAFLIWDFSVRRNPFSIFFAGVGLFHAYKMIRYRTSRGESL